MNEIRSIKQELKPKNKDAKFILDVMIFYIELQLDVYCCMYVFYFFSSSIPT